MCLSNNQGNFQLHRFTRIEYTAKSFRGLLFLTHTQIDIFDIFKNITIFSNLDWKYYTLTATLHGVGSIRRKEGKQN